MERFLFERQRKARAKTPGFALLILGLELVTIH
jgi:hypothetical protein